MESGRFDDLIRTLANESTRRGAIGLLTGMVGLGLEEVAAKGNGKAKGKGRDKPRKRRGGGNGKAHAKTRHDTGDHGKDRGAQGTSHGGGVADE
jgi:hypothetical protein